MQDSMKLVSVNVGQPRVVPAGRGDVLTSIFKEPVTGRRQIALHNIEGDRQADLTVHGGPKKAIYAYAREHYDYWTSTLPAGSLPYGAFGENLTIEGLDEAGIHIGDVVQAGTSILRVTQPRMPCFKLALRFNRPDMVKLFWRSNRSGVYFSIEQTGELGAGDEFRVLERHPLGVSIADVIRLYKGETKDAELYERFIASPLSGSWKEGVRERWVSA